MTVSLNGRGGVYFAGMELHNLTVIQENTNVVFLTAFQHSIPYGQKRFFKKYFYIFNQKLQNACVEMQQKEHALRRHVSTHKCVMGTEIHKTACNLKLQIMNKT